METISMSKNLNKNQNHSVKGKNGGARPGAGRKKGSKQKLSAQTILHEIAKIDKPFAIGLAEDYHNARMSGDTHLVVKYQQLILSKVVADKVDVDHTTGGQPIQTVFNFPQKELVDWTQPTVAFKYESNSKD